MNAAQIEKRIETARDLYDAFNLAADDNRLPACFHTVFGLGLLAAGGGHKLSDGELSAARILTRLGLHPPRPARKVSATEKRMQEVLKAILAQLPEQRD